MTMMDMMVLMSRIEYVLAKEMLDHDNGDDASEQTQRSCISQ